LLDFVNPFNVFFKAVFVGKVGVTDLAGDFRARDIGFCLFMIYLNVPFQMSISCEAFITEIALKWPITGMGEYVCLKTGRTRKSFMATNFRASIQIDRSEPRGEIFNFTLRIRVINHVLQVSDHVSL
jgi:hypothetical protein